MMDIGALSPPLTALKIKTKMQYGDQIPKKHLCRCWVVGWMDICKNGGG